MSDVKGMYIGGSPTYFKDETAREFISDIYDETKTYAVDSYCIHENKLYKCTTETTGGFDGSCWKETNMSTEMVDHTTAIDELNKKTDKFYSSPSMLGINSYHIPDIVQAMPVQSRFFDEVVNSSAYALDSANNKFPINNGLLEIIRPASHVGRTRVLYFAKTNVETYGLYYCLLDETNWTIKGWTKIATTEDVGSGVDTSILGSQSTLPLPTSSFAWNIKQNASDIDSLESLLGTQSILPLPSSTFAYNIQQLNAIVGPQSNLPLPSSSITYNIAQLCADSGWLTATLNSAFELSASTAPVQYRKVGKLVYIRGSIKAAQSVSSDGSATIFTLPEGYRPSRQEYSLQSAASKTYLLSVTSTGAVNVSRCSLSSGDWLGIGASFLVG